MEAAEICQVAPSREGETFPQCQDQALRQAAQGPLGSDVLQLSRGIQYQCSEESSASHHSSTVPTDSEEDMPSDTEVKIAELENQLRDLQRSRKGHRAK